MTTILSFWLFTSEMLNCGHVNKEKSRARERVHTQTRQFERISIRPSIIPPIHGCDESQLVPPDNLCGCLSFLFSLLSLLYSNSSLQVTNTLTDIKIKRKSLQPYLDLHLNVSLSEMSGVSTFKQHAIDLC